MPYTYDGNYIPGSSTTSMQAEVHPSGVAVEGYRDPLDLVAAGYIDQHAAENEQDFRDYAASVGVQYDPSDFMDWVRHASYAENMDPSTGQIRNPGALTQMVYDKYDMRASNVPGQSEYIDQSSPQGQVLMNQRGGPTGTGQDSNAFSQPGPTGQTGRLGLASDYVYGSAPSVASYMAPSGGGYNGSVIPAGPATPGGDVRRDVPYPTAQPQSGVMGWPDAPGRDVAPGVMPPPSGPDMPTLQDVDQDAAMRQLAQSVNPYADRYKAYRDALEQGSDYFYR